MPFKKLLKNITSQLYESGPAVSDDKGYISVTPQNGGAVTPYGATGAATAPFAPSPTTFSTASDDRFYQVLVEATSPDSLAVFQTLKKYLTPIESVILDKKLRYKTAIAQAQSHESLDATTLVAAYDTLIASLDQQQVTFNQQLAEHTHDEVEGRNSKVAEIDTQLAELQSKLTQLQEQKQTLRTEAQVAQTKLENSKGNFVASYSRRKAELLNEKQELQTILA